MTTTQTTEALYTESLFAHLDVYKTNVADCRRRMSEATSREMQAHWSREMSEWGSRLAAIESVIGDVADTLAG